MTNLKQTRPQYGDEIGEVVDAKVIFNDYFNKFIDDIIRVQVPDSGASYALANNQAILAATTTQITLDSKEYDNGSNFASNAYTAPEERQYDITGSIRLTVGAANDALRGFFYKNGSAIFTYGTDSATGVPETMNWSKRVDLAKGDIITLWVRNLNNADTVVAGSYLQVNPV